MSGLPSGRRHPGCRSHRAENRQLVAAAGRARVDHGRDRDREDVPGDDAVRRDEAHRVIDATVRAGDCRRINDRAGTRRCRRVGDHVGARSGREDRPGRSRQRDGIGRETTRDGAGGEEPGDRIRRQAPTVGGLTMTLTPAVPAAVIVYDGALAATVVGRGRHREIGVRPGRRVASLRRS